ncbi:Hypothetical predicted protein [Olea europaea subsp. europaea]|uniref:Uncharacterized protein n=1 Tax=Olea europaea subsp. europaea TaxID=158383 RepID=A0A8S0TG57_OLEEU|nr:Hypothetical predicted protein [Olea europaea subsp. europaea]
MTLSREEVWNAMSRDVGAGGGGSCLATRAAGLQGLAPFTRRPRPWSRLRQIATTRSASGSGSRGGPAAQRAPPAACTRRRPVAPAPATCTREVSGARRQAGRPAAPRRAPPRPIAPRRAPPGADLSHHGRCDNSSDAGPYVHSDLSLQEGDKWIVEVFYFLDVFVSVFVSLK